MTNDLKSVANLRQISGFFSLKMKRKWGIWNEFRGDNTVRVRFCPVDTALLVQIPGLFYISSMNRFKDFVEWNAFGVCSAIGNRMGIATSRIRQYFIYTSLLTMGSPIIIYMVLAFWRNLRKYVTAAKRNPWYYL